MFYSEIMRKTHMKLVVKTISYSLAALVRKYFHHSKIKFISSRNCVISSIIHVDEQETIFKQCWMTGWLTAVATRSLFGVGRIKYCLILCTVEHWEYCQNNTVHALMLALIRSLNPFTPESDQCQISPAASQEIWHHTVRRTWLFITYSDERWF